MKLAQDGSNWVLYKKHITIMFGMCSLSDHLIETTPPARYTSASSKGGLTGQECWEVEEYMFRDLIGMLVPNSVYLCIKGATHTKDMWDQLKGMFEGQS